VGDIGVGDELQDITEMDLQLYMNEYESKYGAARVYDIKQIAIGALMGSLLGTLLGMASLN